MDAIRRMQGIQAWIFFVRDDPNIAVRKTLHFCNETEGVSPYREEKKKITEGKRN